MTKRVPISFEFFPTKTDVGAEKLRVVHKELQLLNPEFFSVTYGAGGSTRERTLAAINDFNGKVVIYIVRVYNLDKPRTSNIFQIYLPNPQDRANLNIFNLNHKLFLN